MWCGQQDPLDMMMRSMWVVVGLMLFSTVNIGCGASRERLMRDLTRRAAFDLNCPRDEIGTRALSRGGREVNVYGVRGCGARATYVLQGSNGPWLLNGSSDDMPSR